MRKFYHGRMCGMVERLRQRSNKRSQIILYIDKSDEDLDIFQQTSQPEENIVNIERSVTLVASFPFYVDNFNLN